MPQYESLKELSSTSALTKVVGGRRAARHPATWELAQMMADIDTRFRCAHGLAKVETFSRTWSGVEVVYDEKYPAAGRAYADLSSEKATVVVCLDHRGGICAPRLNLDQAEPHSRHDSGYFIWVPPNQTVWGYAESVRFIRDITFKFDLKSAAHLVGAKVDPRTFNKPLLQVYDPRVTQCAQLLANVCIDPFENDDVYGEGLITALLSAFFDALAKHAPGDPPSGLAPWQLKLVLRHMEAHYLENVSLSELASLARLSESRFASAFKASTGTPPYTYLIKLKIKKGEKLLLEEKESLPSIAIHLGFADQSHFGKAFRRITGLAPRAWQQAHRPPSIAGADDRQTSVRRP
jgi:AraC family transcriptional regulator